MSDADKNPLDLTGLDFGPAWAKDKKPARDYSKEVGPREGRDRRGKGPRRDSGGGSSDRRKNDRRGSNDRRDQRSDRGQNDHRKRDRRNPQREPRVEAPAPEGYISGVMPVEEGLDNLSKEIQGGGRTYSVFDLARVVMGARERFNITFESPKGSKFFRCKSDGSVWLTKEEAIRHFWQANLLPELYEEVTTEVEAPKGSFTSVAKCGLSGQWLAPPNYHSYPTAVAQLHAEQFAHMSLEDYKRKIRVENGEEVVASWLESQTKKVQFRPLSTKEILTLRETHKAAKEAAKAEKETKGESEKSAENSSDAKEASSEEQPSELAEEAKTDSEPPSEPPVAQAAEATPTQPNEPESSPTEASDTANSDESDESDSAPKEPESKDEAAEAPQEQPPAADLLDTRRDVERHFADHHFKQIFAQVDRAWVPGNVSVKLLSPGLLTLLKATVADERRYPSKLTPILCRQLSGRHLAVFKWKKKLKAGPARPHAVPDDLTLAERPQLMLAWITEHSGKNLEDFWKSFLPEDADAETKRARYHDLHWLLNQGFVLLMADSTIHLAKEKVAAKEPAKKEDSPATKETKENVKEEKAETEETPQAPSPSVSKTTPEVPASEKKELTPSEPTEERAPEPQSNEKE